MFEPTLNLFSRYMSAVRSKRRYQSSRVCVDDAGRDSCRFCCGATIGSEQQHNQDLREIYIRGDEFSNSSLFTTMHCI